MKRIYKIILIAVIAVAAFGGCRGAALAASQYEGAIPQSGDLCGGTGGNGQVVSVGSSTLTLKRNDDGRNQIIHLASGATIRASSGPIALSDLKAGDKVTLVGGPNADGSFTADVVVVCAGTQEGAASQGIQSGQGMRAPDFSKARAWSSYMNAAAMLLVGLIWLGIVALLRLKKKKSVTYLLFFTIFYAYIITALDYTLFQYQSLILLKHLTPDLMLSGIAAGKSLNLVPLLALTLADLRTSLLNILLMMPFGFGLPFIASVRMKKTVLAGMLFSVAIESLQLITGLAASITFRVADINDVIFNTLGAAMGYMLFVGFMRAYRRIVRKWKMAAANPILRYVAERPQVGNNEAGLRS